MSAPVRCKQGEPKRLLSSVTAARESGGARLAVLHAPSSRHSLSVVLSLPLLQQLSLCSSCAMSDVAMAAEDRALDRAYDALERLRDCGLAPPQLDERHLLPAGGCEASLRAAAASLAAAFVALPRARLPLAGWGADALAAAAGRVHGACADETAAEGGRLEAALRELLQVLDPGCVASEDRAELFGACPLVEMRSETSHASASHSQAAGPPAGLPHARRLRRRARRARRAGVRLRAVPCGRAARVEGDQRVARRAAGAAPA